MRSGSYASKTTGLGNVVREAAYQVKSHVEAVRHVRSRARHFIGDLARDLDGGPGFCCSCPLADLVVVRSEQIVDLSDYLRTRLAGRKPWDGMAKAVAEARANP